MNSDDKERTLALDIASLEFSPFPELHGVARGIPAMPESELKRVMLSPTDHGGAIGSVLARYADEAVSLLRGSIQGMPERCVDCAFRGGTIPNRYLPTLAQANRCIVEGDPFMCHHGMKDGEPTQMCRGWLALAYGAPGEGGDRVRRAFWNACGVGPEPEIDR